MLQLTGHNSQSRTSHLTSAPMGSCAPKPARSARTAVILQSSYIPWKGYFDLIARADELILFDDAQYTRRDWRNRNRIKSASGTPWLTIPVEVKGRFEQKICDTRVHDPAWAASHWQRLLDSYRRAPFFALYRELFETLYLGLDERELSAINGRFIKAICHILGIGTKISWSMEYSLSIGKTECLIGLCRAVGATRYLSGPAARDYIEPQLFKDAEIELDYMCYDNYPQYPQLHGPFAHQVSVLDLIFNAGPEASRYMLHVKAAR